MPENQINAQDFITVYRGVPSASFPELLTNTTWCTRWIDGEDEARWVVPEEEQAFMEIGIVHISDIVDPNWDKGWVTITDPSAVDVRHLVLVEGCLTSEEVWLEVRRMFGYRDDDEYDA